MPGVFAGQHWWGGMGARHDALGSGAGNQAGGRLRGRGTGVSGRASGRGASRRRGRACGRGPGRGLARYCRLLARGALCPVEHMADRRVHARGKRVGLPLVRGLARLCAGSGARRLARARISLWGARSTRRPTDSCATFARLRSRRGTFFAPTVSSAPSSSIPATTSRTPTCAWPAESDGFWTRPAGMRGSRGRLLRALVRRSDLRVRNSGGAAQKWPSCESVFASLQRYQ